MTGILEKQDAEYFGKGAKLATGRYIDVMPELREQALTPVTPAMLMDRRTEAAKSQDKALIKTLWHNHFDTGYGFAATKDKIYIHPNSRFLLSSNLNTSLVNYGLSINNDEIDDSFKITERKEHILNKSLTEKQAKQHKLWLELAENSQERLDSYVEQAFRLGKDEHGYTEMMGVYVPEDNKPILRAVFIYRLYYRSDADGLRNLGNDDARLVGVKGGIGTVGSDARRENLESKIKMPTLKQILGASKPFVAEASRQDFEDKIRKLYE